MTKCAAKLMDSISCLSEVFIIVLGRNRDLRLVSQPLSLARALAAASFFFSFTGYHILKTLILPYNSCPKERLLFFVLT